MKLTKKQREAMLTHIETASVWKPKVCALDGREYIGSENLCDNCGRNACMDCCQHVEGKRGRWYRYCLDCLKKLQEQPSSPASPVKKSKKR